MNYELEPCREPKPLNTDDVIRSEHGRIAFNIDYRSHWFVLVKGEYCRYAILVKHGGGEERIDLPRVNCGVVARIIAAQSSDDAYLLMHILFDIHRDASRAAAAETAATYRKAFVDGKLKKRKLPAQGTTKVWIEEVGQKPQEVTNGIR